MARVKKQGRQTMTSSQDERAEDMIQKVSVRVEKVVEFWIFSFFFFKFLYFWCFSVSKIWLEILFRLGVWSLS